MTETAPLPCDLVVVGSGPGGAGVAREAARHGLRVLVLEQGSAAPVRGTLSQMARIAAVPGKGAFINPDASLLVQGVAAGGSTIVNFATAMPPPLGMFAEHGIDLAPALQELRTEVPMSPLPDSLVGSMAAHIMQAARRLGLDWRKLDKMIRPRSCRAGCWRCGYGCPYGAKWTARDFIDDAVRHGARLEGNAKVLRVVVRDGRAAGVEFLQQGRRRFVAARTVVLAGGGIGSPRLLHASGLHDIGNPFFSDPVVAVAGSVDGMEGGAEVPMAAGIHLEQDGIMLADMTLPRPMFQAFAAQVGRFDRLFAHRRTLTLMVKVRDEPGGQVGMRWVSKRLGPADKRKLAQGVALARDILAAAGARHVFRTWHFAAHPGGSLGIGRSVDSDLQTPTPGLFVCDASVIPGAWGLPPTVTLLCLGKRLGKHLATTVRA